MKITIEPAPEMFECPFNGQLIPCRIWNGFMDNGIEIEAYVFSIVPLRAEDHEAMKAKLPAFMRPAQDVFSIDLSDQTKSNALKRALYQLWLSRTPKQFTPGEWEIMMLLQQEPGMADDVGEENQS